MYPFTQEQKALLQQEINTMPDGLIKTECQNWLSFHAGDTIEIIDLDYLTEYVRDTQYFNPTLAFVNWVKGGDRPPWPPRHP